MGLSSGIKERAATVISIVKGLFHIAFMPTLLYLGFSHGAEPGMPELTLLNLLWWHQSVSLLVEALKSLKRRLEEKQQYMQKQNDTF